MSSPSLAFDGLDGPTRPVPWIPFPRLRAPGMTGGVSPRYAVFEPEPHDAQHLRQRGQALFQHAPRDAVLEGRQDGVLRRAAHGDDEGDAEAGAVGVVQRREAGEFLRREACRARPRPVRGCCRRSSRQPSRRGRRGRDGHAAASVWRSAGASHDRALERFDHGVARGEGPRARSPPRPPRARARRCRRRDRGSAADPARRRLPARWGTGSTRPDITISLPARDRPRAWPAPRPSCPSRCRAAWPGPGRPGASPAGRSSVRPSAVPSITPFGGSPPLNASWRRLGLMARHAMGRRRSSAPRFRSPRRPLSPCAEPSRRWRRRVPPRRRAAPTPPSSAPRPRRPG